MTSAIQNFPIDDETWVTISPTVLGGAMAASDERPDLRAAVDALIWADQRADSDPTMPPGTGDPAMVTTILARWRDNGTAALIRRTYHEFLQQPSTGAAPAPAPERPLVEPPTQPSQQTPPLDATSTKTKPKMPAKHPALSAPAKPAKPRTTVATTPAPPKPLLRINPPAPEQPAPNNLPIAVTTPDFTNTPPAPRLPAPATTELMIDEIERWVKFHYHRARISDDPYENQLGRHFLPYFHKVLNLMYTHWEAENERSWPRPHLYEPMPDDDWMNHTKHSQAIVIAADNLDDSFSDIRHAINQLQEIVIRGTEYRHERKTTRDRHFRILSNDATQSVQKLNQSVDELRAAALVELTTTLARETDPTAQTG